MTEFLAAKLLDHTVYSQPIIVHRAIILIAVIAVTLLLDRVASFLDPLGSLSNFPSDLQRAVSCGMGQILVGVAIKTGCTYTLNGGGGGRGGLSQQHTTR